MRAIAWYLLFTLGLGVNGQIQAPLHRPYSNSRHPVPQKVLPIALRYRQKIDEQIKLPPVLPASSRPLLRGASDDLARVVERAADARPCLPLDHLSKPLVC
jgi:hypothetical protein